MHTEKNILHFEKAAHTASLCRNPCWCKNMLLGAWYLMILVFVCIYAGSFCTATTVQDVG